MSNQINYKQKYMELKSKFMSSVDEAFRLGFEQGAQQEQQNQMAQQQQQQQELQAAQAAGMNQGQPGQPGVPNEDPSQEAPPQGAPDSQGGSELDQHIAQLESMLGKSEISGDDLKKALADLKSLQAKNHLESELKKSAKAIPAIAKALHKPAFKIGVQASHNMNSNAKSAVNMQEKIVTDIMKAWADEEQTASSKIADVISVEGLSKKE